MARMKFGTKVEIAILALTLAVNVTRLIRERRSKNKAWKITDVS